MGWFIVDGKTSYVLILIILHVLDDMDCKYIQKKIFTASKCYLCVF